MYQCVSEILNEFNVQHWSYYIYAYRWPIDGAGVAVNAAPESVATFFYHALALYHTTS